MIFTCKQFASHPGSFIPKYFVYMGQEVKEAAGESEKKPAEAVSEGSLAQAKKEYSDRWEQLKKFRDKDPQLMKEQGFDDATMQKLSVRSEVVIGEFRRRLDADKKQDKELVDPEKIFAPEETDKERIQGTLTILDGIIQKYGSEKKSDVPEVIVDEIVKKPKEDFSKASAAAFDKVNRLRHPVVGLDDPSQKNPGTNNYVNNPASLAMLDNLINKISSLNIEVQNSQNHNFIAAATLEVQNMDAEIKKILAVDAGGTRVSTAMAEAFAGENGEKSFKGLPKNSQTDTILMERIQRRFTHMQAQMSQPGAFDIARVPAGTTWTYEEQGFSVRITKGQGRECKAEIVNVGIWVVENYGASFVKYLTPDDRRMVKSFNESTGEVVVERRWAIPESEVPSAVASQYPKLDPEFDKDPSPKRVTVAGDIFEVARVAEGGKKRYKVERIMS